VPEERQEEYHGRVIENSYTSSLPPIPTGAHSALELGRTSCGSRSSQSLSYWIRDRNRTILVGVVDENLFTRECIKGLLEKLDTVEIISFSKCEECMKNPSHQDLILYHICQVKNQAIYHKQFVQLSILVKIAPVIVLSSLDCHDFMVEAFDCGARGFIPTNSTTPVQVIEIIRFVNAGGTYVPPSSLSLKQFNRSSANPPAVMIHQFTERELAILERLRQGKANKVIAHELSISESTIKIHIGNMMRKLNARNRTEVVCRVYDLTGTGAHQ